MEMYYDVYFKNNDGQADVTTVLARSQDEAAQKAIKKVKIEFKQIQRVKVD